MMDKRLAISLMIGFYVLGTAIGFGLSYWFGSSFARELTSSSAAAGVSTTVSVLQRLRNSDTNGAINLLETLLDGDLISLHGALESVPPAKRDAMYVKALKRARDYRAQYPHSSGHATVNAAVSDALKMADDVRKVQ